MLLHTTITSQGQISIPSKFRKILGLKTPSKATIELKGDKLIIKPTKDLLELGGIIREKSLKYTPEKTQKIEKKALGQAMKDKYSK